MKEYKCAFTQNLQDCLKLDIAILMYTYVCNTFNDDYYQIVVCNFNGNKIYCNLIIVVFKLLL